MAELKHWLKVKLHTTGEIPQEKAVPQQLFVLLTVELAELRTVYL